MSTVQNLNSVNLNRNSNSGQYFNNLSTNIGQIGTSQNDALIGYFQDQTNGNKASAKALASAVIYTSLAQGIDPMATLDQFLKLPKGELNTFLVTFLNLNRVGTSYLGVTNTPILNKYIQRSILA
jgi:hypothetical protein